LVANAKELYTGAINEILRERIELQSALNELNPKKIELYNIIKLKNKK